LDAELSVISKIGAALGVAVAIDRTVPTPMIVSASMAVIKTARNRHRREVGNIVRAPNRAEHVHSGRTCVTNLQDNAER
jgi:hypothetical protein